MTDPRPAEGPDREALAAVIRDAVSREVVPTATAPSLRIADAVLALLPSPPAPGGETPPDEPGNPDLDPTDEPPEPRHERTVRQSERFNEQAWGVNVATESPAPGGGDTDLRAILTAERARHKERVGDYRTGYGRHCSLCSVQKSEPFYNERRSWREAADWPCESSVALDAALAALAARPDADRDALARVVREQLRIKMLAAKTTSGRNTYGDGYVNGLSEAIDLIDRAAALSRDTEGSGQ